MPESVFAFTCRRRDQRAPPIAKPTRQPVMLKVSTGLWNSEPPRPWPGDLEQAGGRLLVVHLVVGASCASHQVVRSRQVHHPLIEGQVDRPLVGLFGS